MNTKILFALPLGLLAVACMTPDPGHGAGAARTGGCASGPAIGVCPPGLEHRNKVGLHITPKGLVATPAIVCATKGTEIIFKITPKPATGVTVATIPKDPANDWIIATNKDDPEAISVTVPEDATLKEYEYLIGTGNGQCLDPKFHIDK